MNQELEKLKEVKRWMAGKPEGTKIQYLLALRIYCEYRSLNPKELIDEIEEDRKKSRREIGEVEYKLKEFHNWLLHEKEQMKGRKPKATGVKGVSPKRASQIIGSIRSYYKINGFPITMKLPRALPRKKNKKLNLRSEDIKKLVDHTPTLRDKAIILMLFQSGMDVSTLCSLDYGDIARGLNNNECPLSIHVIRKKANIEYTTFLGKDGIESLKAYLNKREEKQKEIKYDESLFIKEKNFNGKPRITKDLIEKMLRNVAVLSRVVSKEEMERADQNPCRPHALRSAFSSIMKLQGVNNDIVEYWMGHSVPYESAYFIPQEEELKKIYMEHEESLSINRATEQVKELEKKTNEEIAKLYMEKRALEKRIEEMEHSKEKQLGNELVKALENNPELVDQIGELLAKKVGRQDKVKKP